jgi:lysophospholipase L1-like esterase
LFIGDQLTAALVPILRGGGPNADTSTNFVSGDYSRATGITGDGSTKHIDTGLPTNTFTAASRHCSVYVRQRSSIINSCDIGSRVASNTQTWGLGNSAVDSQVYFASATANAATAAATIGHMLGTGDDATNIRLHVRGDVDATAIITAATPGAQNIQVFRRGPANAYSNAILGGYSVGQKLSSSVAKLFSDAWHNAAYRLNRGITWVECIGDSITQGYGVVTPANRWTELLKSVTYRQVFNLGISGRTAQTAATTFASWAREIPQTCVINWHGTNDIYIGDSGINTYGYLMQMVNRHISQGAARVIIPTAMKRFNVAGVEEVQRQDLNARIMATSIHNVVPVDIAADPRLDWSINPGNFSDNVHPNDAGAAIIHEILSPYVSAAGL